MKTLIIVIGLAAPANLGTPNLFKVGKYQCKHLNGLNYCIAVQQSADGTPILIEAIDLENLR